MIGCGSRTVMGHGDNAVCGELYYDAVWYCSNCERNRYRTAIKEWADAHSAMEQKTRGIAPGDDRLWKAEKALKALVE